ncbi:Arm DNA-binding domain-containing protein [Sphingopyxis granuli]|uniref:Arm DNA-binding domain-containing protein n=1 Tax=Sphingopyxis granuli TaxID=267128 RepID=UPI001F5313C5|nr:Arm DNA-binding domain-containing protein [Sphingopyxis granuli]UNK77814.1 Arm DNA-binding domain-containing protein [Sphingopyxis granuli]
MGKFTVIAVKAALTNPGTYQDGDGLFLKVDKHGGAYGLQAFAIPSAEMTPPLF